MPDERPNLLGTVLVLLLVMIIVTILKLTMVVMLPMALGLFILILAWPVQQMLERHGTPRWLAYIVTLQTVFIVMVVFAGLLFVTGRTIQAGAPDYEERVVRFYHDMRALVPGEPPVEGQANEGPRIEDLVGRLLSLAQTVVKGVYGFLGFVAMTVTFLVLGLIEAHGFREKLKTSLPTGIGRRILEAGEEMTSTFQRYMFARTIVSATTGVAVGLYTWAIGLDMPLVWAVMSFLLNYIPMLGSIVAVIPPTLVAFLHPEPGMGWLALGGLTAIQFLIGNYIDPQIEGKILSLSPFVLFFSIIFWGWVWGIPGALMGIPLTAGLVIFCRKFDDTRWFARLLERNP